MKVLKHIRCLVANQRAVFAVMACAVVVLQMAFVVWQTEAYRTVVWRAMHAAGWLHGILVGLADAAMILMPLWIMHRNWRWLQWPVLAGL